MSSVLFCVKSITNVSLLFFNLLWANNPNWWAWNMEKLFNNKCVCVCFLATSQSGMPELWGCEFPTSGSGKYSPRICTSPQLDFQSPQRQIIHTRNEWTEGRQWVQFIFHTSIINNKFNVFLLIIMKNPTNCSAACNLEFSAMPLIVTPVKCL